MKYNEISSDYYRYNIVFFYILKKKGSKSFVDMKFSVKNSET